jgi:FkbM family methyltransferase
MSLVTSRLMGKWNAARSLWEFVLTFRNWADVWAAYRTSAPLPPLELRNGIVLHHGPGDDAIHLFREIFVHDSYLGNGFYHPRPADTIVDIGANIGAFALLIESRARGARVHCFEPGPETRGLLERNISANGLQEYVAVHPFAVSDRRGAVELMRTDLTMHRSIFPNGYASGESDRVETLPLSEALDLAGDRIDLLKIDVEGAEIEIVEGMAPADWGRVERAVIEYHDFFRPGCRERVERVLAGAGFGTIETIEEPKMAGMGLIRARRGGPGRQGEQGPRGAEV